MVGDKRPDVDGWRVLVCYVCVWRDRRVSFRSIGRDEPNGVRSSEMGNSGGIGKGVVIGQVGLDELDNAQSSKSVVNWW